MSLSEMGEYEQLLPTDGAKMLLFGTGKPWPPLPDASPRIAFPVNSLPPALRNYARELAGALQVPLDMAGCAILGALSIACLGTSVHVSRGYNEPTQLYIAITALPSERKSSVFSSVLRPHRDQGKMINDLKTADKATNELKRKMLNKRLDKAISKGDEANAQTLQAELDELPVIKLYAPPLTDVTPEALLKAMEANGGTLSFASAEGGLINIISGLYAELTNIDGILQAWSGESVYIERIGRGAVIMDFTALVILLAMQPQVLERFLANEALLERGLCARFLYSAPRSLLGYRDVRTAKPVSSDTYNRYSWTIQALAKQSYEGIPRELSLDPAAMELYYQWAEDVEKNIGSGGAWHGIANGWEGKLVGNTIRLAGLLKMADSADPNQQISEGHFSAAVELARYFVDQALAVTGKSAGLTPAAREVLDELKKQAESPFSPYELRQKLRFRKRFKDGSNVDEALSCLAASGYIRLPLPPEWQGVGRKPEALYELHPDLLTRKS